MKKSAQFSRDFREKIKCFFIGASAHRRIGASAHRPGPVKP